MNDLASTILRFGPYSMPHGFGVGDTIACDYRCRDVVVAGITDAPIQWLTIRKIGKPFLILCRDPVRAVQIESETAIAFHWGVNRETVRKWRRALSVERMTSGTKQVFRSLFESRVSPEVAEQRRNDATRYNEKRQ